jgi:predicted metal-dependent HD superfamily phosphohydrolase
MRRDPDLEAEVAELYSTTLPYHNFSHALDTILAAGRILEHCREELVPVDEQVVYLALLFHDAGYHEDAGRFGCASKEEYSARLASERLGRRGFDPAIIQLVHEAILATHRDALFRTNEQKVVRAADLAGLAADYPTFLRNSENLKAEWELLRGRPISWRDWIADTQQVIRFFLSQDIRLTRHYLNSEGVSDFHERAEQNVRRLFDDKVGAAAAPNRGP